MTATGEKQDNSQLTFTTLTYSKGIQGAESGIQREEYGIQGMES